uniref:Uncharacterized protein n=1 Tax=Anopheles atroparvus TaxID=41427 RepID=A0A182J9R7_ANOAO
MLNLFSTCVPLDKLERERQTAGQRGHPPDAVRSSVGSLLLLLLLVTSRRWLLSHETAGSSTGSTRATRASTGPTGTHHAGTSAWATVRARHAAHEVAYHWDRSRVIHGSSCIGEKPDINTARVICKPNRKTVGWGGGYTGGNGEQLTGSAERHRSRARVAAEEGRIVRMERWATVAEVELAVRREVREAGLVQAAGRQVHREAAHLPSATEERPPAHAGQLLQPSFFRALILKPNLPEAGRNDTLLGKHDAEQFLFTTRADAESRRSFAVWHQTENPPSGF